MLGPTFAAFKNEKKNEKRTDNNQKDRRLLNGNELHRRRILVKNSVKISNFSPMDDNGGLPHPIDPVSGPTTEDEFCGGGR